MAMTTAGRYSHKRKRAAPKQNHPPTENPQSIGIIGQLLNEVKTFPLYAACLYTPHHRRRMKYALAAAQVARAGGRMRGYMRR